MQDIVPALMKQATLTFEPLLTKGQHPFETVKWVRRNAVIIGADGKEKFRQDNVEVPEWWNETTINVVTEKYFRVVNGVKESSAKQMFGRVAKWLKENGIKQGLFAEKDAEVFERELLYMLVHGMHAFNSPVWFNVGVAENPQCSACMPYDVPVNTTNGLLPIGEIVERLRLNPNEALFTYDQEGKPTRIKAAICNGKRYVVEFGLEDGSSLRMTSDHVVFAKLPDGRIVEKQAGDLTLNEDLLILSEKPLVEENFLSTVHNITLYEDLCWVAGLMIGNGYSGRPDTSTSDVWEIKINTEAEKRRAEAVFEKHGVPVTTTQFHWGYTLRGYGSAGRAFWQRLDLWEHTWDKKIPTWALRLNRKNLGAFLRGLFDTDGTVAQQTNGRVTVQLSNTSFQVIERSRSLLRNLGIFSTTREYEDTRPEYDRQTSYYLTINDIRSVERFAELVGFTNSNKAKELEDRDPDLSKAYKVPYLTVVSKRKVGSTLVYDIQTEAGCFWADGVLVHNCFIQSIDDTMESIMGLAQREVLLFKGGSGTGSNLSPLRSSWESLSGGGRPSGPVSFMKGFDSFAGVTKSGGTTRRAAKLIALNVDHPDIYQQRSGEAGFIGCKAKAEELAHDLYSTGKYTAEWNKPGNVYDLVCYQNANNSVRVTESFMQAVENGKKWETRTKEGKVVHTYEAQMLWEEIAKAAWVCGDPGIQFDTSTNEWNTVPESGRINASNPCSEYLFLDDTSCNLSSLNLLKFAKGRRFDHESFIHACALATTAKEIIVDAASYPSPLIAEKTKKFRTLGLGFTNLGALLTYWGLPYDSNEGRSVAAAITAIMGGAAQRQSAQMAFVKGPFEEYEKNKSYMLRVVAKHWDAAKRLPTTLLKDWQELPEVAYNLWKDAYQEGKKYGYRNAQVTVIAPTGTISFLMGADTTALEPMLGIIVYKKVVGEGVLKLPNSVVDPALQNLGYSQEQRAVILSHVSETGNIHSAPGFDPKHSPVFAESLGPRALSPEAHVDMMAAIQPFISGGISKTVNMPKDCSWRDIADIYMRAWKGGLKCVAVYRDGCKLSQPISTELTESGAHKIKLSWGERRRMPTTRKSITHKFNIDGQEGYIHLGMYPDGSAGEMFFEIAKQGSTLNGLTDAFATAVSIGLQHGVPLKTFIEKFVGMEFEPKGIIREGHEEISKAKSIPDYIFKFADRIFFPEEAQAAADMMEYTKIDETKQLAPSHDGPPCRMCGNMTKRSGSCYCCTACGTTTGCS